MSVEIFQCNEMKQLFRGYVADPIKIPISPRDVKAVKSLLQTITNSGNTSIVSIWPLHMSKKTLAQPAILTLYPWQRLPRVML